MKHLFKRFCFKNFVKDRVFHSLIFFHQRITFMHCFGGIKVNEHKPNCFLKCKHGFSFKRHMYKSQELLNLKTPIQTSENVTPRPKTRQPVITKETENSQICTTYATADHYRLMNLVGYVSQDIRLREVILPIDVTNAAVFLTSDVNITKINKDGYIVFFREGVVSFWNISEVMMKEMIKLVRRFEVEPYKVHLVNWESEKMEYNFFNGKSKFTKNGFQLSAKNEPEQICCDIYAFSNALMASVKLAHWEQSLDVLIRSIESLPHALMKGSFLRNESPKVVLRKLGEVLMIRHRLNLQYNMLDVPDVYWDEENLEKIYIQTTEFLNIQRRVKVMNEKLSYCAHVVELVKSHMAEQKSIRIEILIVVLIMIEVLFELVHFYVKPYFDNKRVSDDDQ